MNPLMNYIRVTLLISFVDLKIGSLAYLRTLETLRALDRLQHSMKQTKTEGEYVQEGFRLTKEFKEKVQQARIDKQFKDLMAEQTRALIEESIETEEQ